LDADVTEATDWVEYLNGNTSTPYGKIRAQRGHPEPYNVQYFYLGNEIAFQARYPNYPNVIEGVNAPSVAEYKQMCLNIVGPMLAKSPELPLRLLTVSDGGAWDQNWAAAVGKNIYATSFHAGYFNQPASSPSTWTEAAVTNCAKHPYSAFLPEVWKLRESLDATGHTIAISADEWGLGPPWTTESFSVAHGMYAAGFLGAITRVSTPANLQFTNYFEPVNEGAITVHSFNATLTPVGEVMALYANHQGNALVASPAGSFGGDLDLIASVNPTTGELVITVANLNAVGWAPYNVALTIDGGKYRSTAGSVTTLHAADGFGPTDLFTTESSTATVDPHGLLKFTVPPFSVVHLKGFK